VDKGNRPNLSHPEILVTDPKSHDLASFGSPRNSKDRTARS
jgi:hypothetical protein